MAHTKIGNNLGVVAVSKSTSADVPSNTGHPSDLQETFNEATTNYSSISNMRARLTALGYTADTLNKMTENDMIFAIRSADHPSTIKQ